MSGVPCVQEAVYVRVKVLGRGAFGEAVLYRKGEDNSLVVWKEVELTRLSDRGRKDVQTEIEIIALLSHVNIVSYFNHYLHENMLYIEMEYVNGGTLAHKIAAQDKLFSEEIVLWYFYQIASGLQYMHLRGIIHRDVKTLNIFLMKSGILKFGDFGMSKLLSMEQMADTVLGTPYYMSPELVRGMEYNYKSDIWAMGCVFHEILTLHKTFQASNTLRLAAEIMKGEYTPIDAQYSPEIDKVVRGCLEQDQENRLSAQEVLLNAVLVPREREFKEKINNLRGHAAEFPPSRPSTAAFRTGEGNDSSTGLSGILGSTVAIETTSTELFAWGGGKTRPQKYEQFCDGTSALNVAIGGTHMAVITIEKELYTWAAAQEAASDGMKGQLGHGDSAFYKQPKLVEAFVGIPVTYVACGLDFTCCVTETGKLYTFGANYHGCLGCGEQVKQRLVPEKVDLFEGETIVDISCGEQHVLALTKTGEVYCWGQGEFGKLGLESEENQFIPAFVPLPMSCEIKQVCCGIECSFLLCESGRVLACGSNEDNRIGLNQKIDGVIQNVTVSYDIPFISKFTPILSLTRHKIIQLATGANHTAVINDFGHVITFGSNEYGQLGSGDLKPHFMPLTVKGDLSGKKANKVACGNGFTVACTTDNQVFAWGFADNGRIGIDLPVSNKGVAYTSLPRPIFGSLYNMTAIACSGWSTLLVAEKVLSHKSLKTSSATLAKDIRGLLELSGAENSNANFALADPTQEQSEAAFLEFDSFVPHVNGRDNSSDPKNVMYDNEKSIDANDSSNVPPWLAAELLDADILPTAKAENELEKLKRRVQVLEAENSALKKELDAKDKLIKSLELRRHSGEVCFEI